MKQIRKNVFETNSSSTHSLTMCSEEEYEKWQREELIYDRWEGDLIEITDEIKQYRKDTYELNDSYLYNTAILILDRNLLM